MKVPITNHLNSSLSAPSSVKAQRIIPKTNPGLELTPFIWTVDDVPGSYIAQGSGRSVSF